MKYLTAFALALVSLSAFGQPVKSNAYTTNTTAVVDAHVQGIAGGSIPNGLVTNNSTAGVVVTNGSAIAGVAITNGAVNANSLILPDGAGGSWYLMTNTSLGVLQFSNSSGHFAYKLHADGHLEAGFFQGDGSGISNVAAVSATSIIGAVVTSNNIATSGINVSQIVGNISAFDPVALRYALTTNYVNTNVIISFGASSLNNFMNSRWVYRRDPSSGNGSFTNGTTIVITNGAGSTAGLFIFCDAPGPTSIYSQSANLQTNVWSLGNGVNHNGDGMVTLFEGTVYSSNIWPPMAFTIPSDLGTNTTQEGATIYGDKNRTNSTTFGPFGDTKTNNGNGNSVSLAGNSVTVANSNQVIQSRFTLTSTGATLVAWSASGTNLVNLPTNGPTTFSGGISANGPIFGNGTGVTNLATDAFGSNPLFTNLNITHIYYTNATLGTWEGWIPGIGHVFSNTVTHAASLILGTNGGAHFGSWVPAGASNSITEGTNTSGYFVGNGAGITGLTGSNIVGTIPAGALPTTAVTNSSTFAAYIASDNVTEKWAKDAMADIDATLNASGQAGLLIGLQPFGVGFNPQNLGVYSAQGVTCVVGAGVQAPVWGGENSASFTNNNGLTWTGPAFTGVSNYMLVLIVSQPPDANVENTVQGINGANPPTTWNIIGGMKNSDNSGNFLVGGATYSYNPSLWVLDKTNGLTTNAYSHTASVGLMNSTIVTELGATSFKSPNWIQRMPIAISGDQAGNHRVWIDGLVCEIGSVTNYSAPLFATNFTSLNIGFDGSLNGLNNFLGGSRQWTNFYGQIEFAALWRSTNAALVDLTLNLARRANTATEDDYCFFSSIGDPTLVLANAAFACTTNSFGYWIGKYKKTIVHDYSQGSSSVVTLLTNQTTGVAFPIDRVITNTPAKYKHTIWTDAFRNKIAAANSGSQVMQWINMFFSNTISSYRTPIIAIEPYVVQTNTVAMGGPNGFNNTNQVAGYAFIETNAPIFAEIVKAYQFVSQAFIATNFCEGTHPIPLNANSAVPDATLQASVIRLALNGTPMGNTGSGINNTPGQMLLFDSQAFDVIPMGASNGAVTVGGGLAVSGAITGNGGGLTNLNSTNLSGTITANANGTATVTGTLAAGNLNTSGFVQGGSFFPGGGGASIVITGGKMQFGNGGSIPVTPVIATNYTATAGGGASGFIGCGSGLTNLGGVFTIATNSTQMTITNTQGCRGTWTVNLAFDDVTGGNPSCTIWETNSVFTNFFGTISPNLSGLTLVGTVSVTNYYSFPAQTNATLTIVDTSSGGATVRKIIGQIHY